MAAKRTASEQARWNKFADNIKKKRLANTNTQVKPKGATENSDNATLGANILKQGEMIVQQLESEPSGKAKKYERLGAQEFVKFTFDEVSIHYIKEACEKHFQNRLPVGMTCDVLATERGPSCTKTSHLNNFKVIHVRFIKKEDSDSGISSRQLSRILKNSPFSRNNDFVSGSFSATSSQKQGSHHSTTTSVPRAHSDKNSSCITSQRQTFAMKIIPKSISVSTMLKLGNVISKVEEKYQKIELSNFNIEKDNCFWTQPITVEMKIEKKSFAQGGFRIVYKSSSREGKPYVIKKFLQSSLDTIQQVNETVPNTIETIETFSRRAIQAHMLAKNFTDQLKSSVTSFNLSYKFGETFDYCKAMLGKIVETGEYVMVETFVPGEVRKYINNDGEIIPDLSNVVIVEKAECLTHFSFVKSKEELLLVDIQGCKYHLFDPEIASAHGLVSDNGFQFSLGNLSTVAFDTFKKQHKCNKYCKLLELLEFKGIIN